MRCSDEITIRFHSIAFGFLAHLVTSAVEQSTSTTVDARFKRKVEIAQGGEIRPTGARPGSASRALVWRRHGSVIDPGLEKVVLALCRRSLPSRLFFLSYRFCQAGSLLVDPANLLCRSPTQAIDGAIQSSDPSHAIFALHSITSSLDPLLINPSLLLPLLILPSTPNRATNPRTHTTNRKITTNSTILLWLTPINAPPHPSFLPLATSFNRFTTRRRNYDPAWRNQSRQ